jgi:hypothetical protein
VLVQIRAFVSRKSGIICDMYALSTQVLDRIQAMGQGAVFISKDFLDLGSNEAVRQSLSRLARRGAIRRINQGVYDYPRQSPRFGTISPSLDAVAAAVSSKNGNRLLASGAYAANVLGLSTQVPARIVYFTDGSDKRLQVDGQTIEFRHASPRRMTGAGKISGLVFQALRYIGKDNVDGATINRLQSILTDDDRQTLRQDITAAPVWLRPIIEQITENA